MVSSLGLGTLTWGRDTDLEQASQQLRMFLDAGGNLLDTAATYGEGESEKLIGTLLDEEFSREDLVICSKAGVRAGDPPRLMLPGQIYYAVWIKLYSGWEPPILMCGLFTTTIPLCGWKRL